MKTAVIRTATGSKSVARNNLSARTRVLDLAELVKARLTLLVLMTTAAGFYLGAQSPINYAALFHVVFGTAAAAAGAAALNQWWERKLDALMCRTRTRPVPAGRMRPAEALGQHREYPRRRRSWGDSANDRLGGGARNNRGGDMESLRDPPVVAVAAFLRDSLDVPR